MPITKPGDGHAKKVAELQFEVPISSIESGTLGARGTSSFKLKVRSKGLGIIKGGRSINLNCSLEDLEPNNTNLGSHNLKTIYDLA